MGLRVDQAAVTNNNAGVCLGHFSFDARKATDQLRRRSRFVVASVESANEISLANYCADAVPSEVVFLP